MKTVNTARFLLYTALVVVGVGVGTFPLTMDAVADPAAARSYQVGDQVEVQWPGDDKWYAAKVTEAKDGRYFIVYDQDGNNAWYKPDRMRLVKAATPPPAPPAAAPADDDDGEAPATTPPKRAPKSAPQSKHPQPGTVGNKVTEAADGTLSADRPILIGPVKQKPVKNGTRPNPELLIP